MFLDLSLNSKMQKRIPVFINLPPFEGTKKGFRFSQYCNNIAIQYRVHLYNTSSNLKYCNIQYRCKTTLPRVLFCWWHICSICLSYNSYLNFRSCFEIFYNNIVKNIFQRFTRTTVSLELEFPQTNWSFTTSAKIRLSLTQWSHNDMKIGPGIIEIISSIVLISIL